MCWSGFLRVEFFTFFFLLGLDFKSYLVRIRGLWTCKGLALGKFQTPPNPRYDWKILEDTGWWLVIFAMVLLFSFWVPYQCPPLQGNKNLSLSLNPSIRPYFCGRDCILNLYQNTSQTQGIVDGRNPKQPPGMVLKPCK